MGNVRKSQRPTTLKLAGLILAYITMGPSWANATVFWDDEMEPGNTGYELPGPGMTFDTTMRFSGSGSLRYIFGPECYPDSSAQSACGGHTDRTFPATDTFYRRIYVRLSAGFTVSDAFTKMFRSNTNDPSPNGGASNWWGLGCCGSFLFGVGNQNVPERGMTTNNPSTFSIPTNQWVCLETQEQMNTPGVANGISRAWADGVLILNETDVKFRQADDTFQYVSNRFYRQTGLGSMWFDKFAVGNTRIGCVETPQQDDPGLPQPPTLLRPPTPRGLRFN